MSDSVRKRRYPAITVRPSAEEKQRFVELAAGRGLSESRAALLAIRHYLELSRYGPAPVPETRTGTATDRITIRLRPGDREAIGWRASQRGVKASSYIAGLVRAHVATSPPLTKDELQALKVAVTVLAGTGRVLHELARRALATGQLPEDLRQQISRTGAAVKVLDQRTREFAHTALVAWESDFG